MKLSLFISVPVFLLSYQAMACKMLPKGWETNSKRAVQAHLQKIDQSKTIETMEFDSGKVLVYFKGQKTLKPQSYRVTFAKDCGSTVFRILPKKIKTH